MQYRKATNSLRRINHAVLGVVCLMVLLFTFSSCSDNSQPDEVKTRTVSVVFTLSVADPTESSTSSAKQAPAAVTRASDADPWNSENDREKGTGIDNNIDASKLHVVFYNQQGNPVGDVQNLRLTQLSTQTSDGKYYEVYGNLDIDVNNISSDSTFKGKVVVYTNADAPAGGFTQGLSAISDSYTYSYNGSNPSSIPMWGFKNLSLQLRGGEAADLGDIFLLRAMAKVTVKLTNDMIKRGYTFDGVTLTNYNTVGYVAPTFDSFSNITADNGGTESLSMANSFHLNTSASTGSINLTLANNNDSTVALYIPEYDNTKQTTSTITVRVKHDDGDIRTATFDFGTYDSNGNWSSAMNIVRNHHYVFRVYGNPIRIIVTEEPWTVIDHGNIIAQ